MLVVVFIIFLYFPYLKWGQSLLEIRCIFVIVSFLSKVCMERQSWGVSGPRSLLVTLWTHCCAAADSWCSGLFAAALWVDVCVWLLSRCETLYCVHHLHFSLLFPASPTLRWWSPNLAHLVLCRCWKRSGFTQNHQCISVSAEMNIFI